jgi:hypothetical protein
MTEVTLARRFMVKTNIFDCGYEIKIGSKA